MIVDSSGGISVKKYFEYYGFLNNTHNKVTGYTTTGEYVLPLKNINNKFNINIFNERICLNITGSTHDWLVDYINLLATSGYTGYDYISYENRIIFNETENLYYKIEYTDNYNNVVKDTSERWAITDYITGEQWVSGNTYFDETDENGNKTGRSLVMLKNINPNSETRYNIKYVKYNKEIITTPSIGEPDIIEVGSRNVYLTVEYASLGDEPITEMGVYYSVFSNSNQNDLIKRQNNTPNIGSFEFNLFNLIPNTTYYIRGYIKTSSGIIYYGNESIFKTEFTDNIVDLNSNVSDLILENTYTFLQFADLHGDMESLENIIVYSNAIPTINEVINCGDITEESYKDSTFLMVNKLSELKKPYYPIIGNHEKCTYIPSRISQFSKADSANTAQVYNKFMQPFEYQRIGDNGYAQRIIPTGGTPYYVITDEVNKIKKFFLYEFDNDLESEVSTDRYAVSRGVRVFSQEQINWFCNNLQNTTSEYSVMIALHMPPYYMKSSKILWTPFKSLYPELGESEQICENWMLIDIVNAWLNQTSIINTYHFIETSQGYYDENTKEYLESISNKDNKNYTVNVNQMFSDNDEPKFIGYFFGHIHADAVGKLTLYEQYQNLIGVTTSNHTNGFTRYDDLIRSEGTKSQDAFNVCSIDTQNRNIRIVRIGASINKDGLERDYIDLNY